jgi:hypothetical protein
MNATARIAMPKVIFFFTRFSFFWVGSHPAEEFAVVPENPGGDVCLRVVPKSDRIAG